MKGVRLATSAAVETYLSGGSVLFYNSKAELPNLGDENILYIVKELGYEAIYRWDNTALMYYIIANNYENIKVINGGTASL